MSFKSKKQQHTVTEDASVFNVSEVESEVITYIICYEDIEYIKSYEKRLELSHLNFTQDVWDWIDSYVLVKLKNGKEIRGILPLHQEEMYQPQYLKIVGRHDTKISYRQWKGSISDFRAGKARFEKENEE